MNISKSIFISEFISIRYVQKTLLNISEKSEVLRTVTYTRLCSGMVPDVYMFSGGLLHCEVGVFNIQIVSELDFRYFELHVEFY